MKNTTESFAASVSILPRVIRLKDAPAYLGMDRNRFNKEVRPSLICIPIGTQGVAFDRMDLDAWFEQYKARFGRHSHRMPSEYPEISVKAKSATNQARSRKTRKPTSTRLTSKEAFAKAVASAISKKLTRK